jgi:membrane protease subunit HflC
MNRIFSIVTALVIIIALLFLTGAVYIVPETRQAVITQFGQPIGKPVTDAGIHLKKPFIQKVNHFDKRLLNWDGDPNQIPTRDKKYIWVDTTARWKIDNALKFLESVGTERGAQARLDDIINSATRDVITSHLLVEAIRNTNRILDSEAEVEEAFMAEEALEYIEKGRTDLEQEMLDISSELAPQYGIKIVDVRIKRINYVENVRRKVYQRMISERKRAAEKYRSEGQGKSAEIKGEKEKKLKQITSEAYRKAQSIRGKADAESISIYAEAYSRDVSFYSFFKTLETYEKTMDSNTDLIMSTESDYYKYLNKVGE